MPEDNTNPPMNGDTSWLPGRSEADLEKLIAKRDPNAPVYYPPEISSRRRAVDRVVTGTFDGVNTWLQRHWLAAVNTLLGLFVAGAFLGPYLGSQGQTGIYGGFMAFYHIFCAQTPTHSYTVFGHQLCLCQRCLAIYGSLFLGGVGFSFVRKRLAPLDWKLYAILVLPMAVDGFTQLFGWRTSDWELRTVTGVLFGLGTVWFLHPWAEQSLMDYTPPPSRAKLGPMGGAT